MKTIYAFALQIIFGSLFINSLIAQPVWVQNIALVNDSSSSLNTVKVLTNQYDQVYVLMSYQNNSSGNAAYKVYLNKYTSSGNLIWNYIFDNSGTGSPRAFDMAVDNVGNAYLAGGLMQNSPINPFIMKVDTGGVMQWLHIGSTGINTDWYSKVQYRSNNIYVGSNQGVAAYSTSGTELYTVVQNAAAFNVDYSGRIIIAGTGPTNNIFRYDVSGNLDFGYSSIYAQKIEVDYLNNFYLITGTGAYELVKYNAQGTMEWTKNNFPTTPPFGDLSYGIIFDGNNDIIVYSVADSMYKFNLQGQLIWAKSLSGMDDYYVDGKIMDNGFIALTGTFNGFAGGDISTRIYNVNGDLVWSDLYSGILGGTEFVFILDTDNNSIYVLGQQEQSVNLIRYINPSSLNSIDFNAICVDSIWYSSADTINVRLFNGSFNFINYPTVDIVSPAGDTISHGILNFFGQVSNSYQVYIATITQPGITDFSNFTFVLNIAFPDTSVQIQFCTVTAISANNPSTKITLYPNPGNEILYINLNNNYQTPAHFTIYNAIGDIIVDKRNITSNVSSIDIASLKAGFYYLKVTTENSIETLKFVKE